MSIDEKKKYNAMENVLNTINQKYISLNETEKKTNNAILNKVLSVIIGKMKEQSELFKNLYQSIFFGGSYYDGLKICNPEEFDLDVLLVLPKLLETEVVTSDKPGYVHVFAKEYAKFVKTPQEFNRYPRLDLLLTDDMYFSTEKTRSWMESLLTKVMQTFADDKIVVEVDGKTLDVDIMKFIKGGPAFTLKLKTVVDGKETKLDVDFVACFIFKDDRWPKGYRPNPSSRKTFFVVPKKPTKDSTENGKYEKYWRLSFQEQERELISGNHLNRLKPTVKLLKQLRDKQNHKGIASYYIKTIFLWELENTNKDFWNSPLSYIFMTMLNKYSDYIKSGQIKYYWYDKNNLLGGLRPCTADDFGNKLKNIIDDVEKNLHDPFVIAKYLLLAGDVESLRKQTPVSKKVQKTQQINPTVNATTPLPERSYQNSALVKEPSIKNMMMETLTEFFSDDSNSSIEKFGSQKQDNKHMDLLTFNDILHLSVDANENSDNNTEFAALKLQYEQLQLKYTALETDYEDLKRKNHSTESDLKKLETEKNRLVENYNTVIENNTKLTDSNQKLTELLSSSLDPINKKMNVLIDTMCPIKSKTKTNRATSSLLDDDLSNFLGDKLTLTASMSPQNEL